MFEEIDIVEAVKSNLESADNFYASSALADAATQYTRALDFISRIPIDSFSRLNKFRYPAVLGRARCYEELKLFEQAIMDFSWVVEILSQENMPYDEQQHRARALATMKIGKCFYSLGFFPEAQKKFVETECLLDSGELQHIRDLDAERGSLLAHQAKCYRVLHSFEAAESYYEKSISKFETAIKNGWTDSQNDRAMVFMNMGNFLHAMGRFEDALSCYKKTVQCHELNGLDGLEQVSRIILNKAICLTSMGKLKEANRDFDDAHKFYWGDNLWSRQQLNSERILLAMNRGICLLKLEKIAEAKASYFEALQLLESEDLKNSRELHEDCALVLMNLANCFLLTEDNSQAEELIDTAFENLQLTHLKPRVDLDPSRLAILASGSQLLNFRTKPGEWIRRASKECIRATMEIAPDIVSPWADMREHFSRVHRNWLSWCLTDSSRYKMIPEVLSAVQGREISAACAEQFMTIGNQDEDNVFRQYSLLKTELRQLIGQMHRLAGTDIAPVGRTGQASAEFDGIPVRPTSLLSHLSSKCEAAREGLQKLKFRAAREHGLSAFLADHRTLGLKDIQEFLVNGEQVLLAFEHEDEFFALLIEKSIEPDLVPLPGLKNVVERRQSFHANAFSGNGSSNSQEINMQDAFWKPLNDKIFEGSTLIVATSGTFHNVSFEPGKPKHIKLLTRVPSISHLALTRGFFGHGFSQEATGELEVKASILVDDNARDIPLACLEGLYAARLWEETGTNPDYPTGWPARSKNIEFLHIAGHGTLETGLVGSQHAVILKNGIKIGEPELVGTSPPTEVLINSCIAGQSYDNPLDGNPTGIVPTLLRHGTKWVVASLFPLADTWALLAGLVLTDLRSSSDGELPELLEVSRERLVEGGWPDRVSVVFSDALIASISEPRYGPDKMPDGKLVRRLSFVTVIESDLTHVDAGKLVHARQRLEDRFSEESSLSWWLEHDPNIVDKLLAAPSKAQRTLEDTIRSAVEYMQLNGTPNIPEVETVRYGWTLFGDPNPVGGIENG